MSIIITRGEAFEDSAPFLMARVTNAGGTNFTQSLTSSIAYTVYNETDAVIVVTSTALTVSDVIFDTLQTDARWTVDSTGYNFGWALPIASIPDGLKKYLVDIIITPLTGAGATVDSQQVVPVVFVISTTKRFKA